MVGSSFKSDFSIKIFAWFFAMNGRFRIIFTIALAHSRTSSSESLLKLKSNSSSSAITFKLKPVIIERDWPRITVLIFRRRTPITNFSISTQYFSPMGASTPGMSTVIGSQQSRPSERSKSCETPSKVKIASSSFGKSDVCRLNSVSNVSPDNRDCPVVGLKNLWMKN